MNTQEILPLIIYNLCLILFLILSAFFSGTEAAFFSLNSLEREHLRTRAKSRWKHFVEYTLSQPDLILITLLTGNTLVNVFATDFFATLVIDKILAALHIPEKQLFAFLSLSEFISIIVMTLLILIFGEMMAKNIAVRHPLAMAGLSVYPLYVIEKILKPLTAVLNLLQSRIVNRVTGRIAREEDEDVSSDLLSLVVQIGYKEKMLNKFELDLFESFIEFSTKTAGEVMIPRTELKGIDITTTIEELFRLTLNKQQEDVSYIYVYNKDFDHLAGYINLKDLLPCKYGLIKCNDLKELMKPFHSIPDSKKLTALIRELREQNQEVAHVVDEYGGTAGIITFQNLIQDVFEHFYVPDLHKIIEEKDGWYKVPGSVELYRIEELLHVDFTSEMRTLSGMLIDHLGEIPESGKYVSIGNIEFIIHKVSNNRIISLEMRKK